MSEVSLLYVDGAQIGYGRLGVYLAEILAKRGVTVYNDDGNPNAAALTVKQRAEGKRTFATPPTNLNCYVSVPSHMGGYHDGQHRAIITMWEAMTLPESFRDNFHEIDTLIVPSYQNLELFRQYHDNVHLMLLGVDPALWHYIKPEDPTREFRFLISGRGERKGVDLAFRAFREVFGHYRGTGPQPRLIMKSLKGHNKYFGNNIEHVTGRLDPIAERDLYASAHCYLQPSRGEGFGLQPLQAMALGRPTILTNAHGHESYAHMGIPIGWKAEHSGEFLFGDAGDWWEPDFDELCEQMWHVYKSYDAYATQAKAAAVEIAKSWTWDNTADRFVELLGPEMDKPYTGSGEWIVSSHHLFPIITNRDYPCDIAGRTLYFIKGKTYHESADVKRNLFDGGVLDPACIDEDGTGLAPIQVEQLGEYRAIHEFCPTCGQQMNTGVTKADLLEAEMADV